MRLLLLLLVLPESKMNCCSLPTVIVDARTFFVRSRQGV